MLGHDFNSVAIIALVITGIAILLRALSAWDGWLDSRALERHGILRHITVWYVIGDGVALTIALMLHIATWGFLSHRPWLIVIGLLVGGVLFAAAPIVGIHERRSTLGNIRKRFGQKEGRLGT